MTSFIKLIKKNTGLRNGNESTEYNGYSLVEMLITMAIISVILILVASTITALIKASAISTAKTLSRNESEFILEYVRRTIRNAEIEEIKVYNTYSGAENCRFVNSDDEVELNGISGCILEDIYMDTISPATIGNEIHIRPSGSAYWVCIGFFPDETDSSIGYLLKTSAIDLEDHENCFDPSLNGNYARSALFLNSDEIDVNSFEVKYFVSGEDENTLMTVDLEIEPIHWVPGKQSQFKPQYRRQTVVSTQKLTWEE